MKRNLWLPVLVAALGYFVDLYDIVIFGVVRVASLQDLGLSGQAVTDWGIWLLNLQMAGMLVGGLAWGVIGDRYGRRFALLATIALYSTANILNGFVTNVEQYAVLRTIAGFGLAGELGAGVTLISEILPKNRRGYGTTAISFLGLCGALFASYVGSHFDWRFAYIAGGLLGLLVLAGRWKSLPESDLFERGREGAGDLRLLVSTRRVFLRYLAVIAIGVPIWYVSALFVTLAPEFGRALKMPEPLVVADVLRWQALGLAIGSGLSGLISEWIHSRKRVLYVAIAGLGALCLLLLQLEGTQPSTYVYLMFVVGLFQGYWTAFITLSAEQFGTNIRATVAISVPNFVRAMTIPVTLSLQALMPTLGFLPASFAIGVVVFALAAVSLWKLRETYGMDLNYREG